MGQIASSRLIASGHLASTHAAVAQGRPRWGPRLVPASGKRPKTGVPRGSSGFRGTNRGPDCVRKWPSLALQLAVTQTHASLVDHLRFPSTSANPPSSQETTPYNMALLRTALARATAPASRSTPSALSLPRTQLRLYSQQRQPSPTVQLTQTPRQHFHAN